MAPESFIIGLLSFGLHLIFFLLLLRIKITLGWLVLEVLSGIIVLGISIYMGFNLVQNFSIWYAISFFMFLWFCFFFVSGIFYVSVSVGIILFLNKQPEKSSTIDVLYQECVRSSFLQRVDFLIRSGLVEEKKRGYVISGRGISSIKRIQRIRKILGLKIAGFYSK